MDIPKTRATVLPLPKGEGRAEGEQCASNWNCSAIPLLALAGWFALFWLSRNPPARILWWMLGILAAQWLLAACVWRQSANGKMRTWLAWGIVFRIVGLIAMPILEDDHFRFLWDGRMFAITGNPYATTPSEHFADASLPPEFATILDQINYPHVPTIYGPVSELGFLISYLIAPALLWPWKLLIVLADIGLLLALRPLGRSADIPVGSSSDLALSDRAAVFAAWCPLSIFETAFNAHPDSLAVSLMCGALLARKFNRDGWLGFCCGVAISAKILAVLVVPFLLWGRRLKAWLWCGATLLACYLPFWLQGTLADWTGLRTFAREWEFNSSGYALLSWAWGPTIARPLAAALFGIAWLAIFWRGAERGQLCPPAEGSLAHSAAGLPIPPGLLVFGLFFLLSPTFNPWYALWFLPFVALQPTLMGITVLATVSLSYITCQNLGLPGGYEHPIWVRLLEFGLIGVTLLIDFKRSAFTRHGTAVVPYGETPIR